MRDIEKRIMKQMIFWLALGVGISLCVNFIMFGALGDAAFPWNLVVQMGVAVLLLYIMMRRQLSRMHGSGGAGIGLFGNSSELRYRCRQCGTVYKGSKCKACGSKGGIAFFS